MDDPELFHGDCPRRAAAKVRRMLEFSADEWRAEGARCRTLYYGDAPDFEQVLDLVEAASDGLLVHLQAAGQALARLTAFGSLY